MYIVRPSVESLKSRKQIKIEREECFTRLEILNVADDGGAFSRIFSERCFAWFYRKLHAYRRMLGLETEYANLYKINNETTERKRERERAERLHQKFRNLITVLAATEYRHTISRDVFLTKPAKRQLGRCLSNSKSPARRW